MSTLLWSERRRFSTNSKNKEIHVACWRRFLFRIGTKEIAKINFTIFKYRRALPFYFLYAEYAVIFIDWIESGQFIDDVIIL